MNITNGNFGLTGFKVQRQKFGIGSLLFLLVFGAIFSGVGLTIYKSMQIDKSWTRLQGQVVDVSSSTSDGSTTYAPIVRYTVNGTDYRAKSGMSSSSNPTIGESREVAYNPAQPSESKVVEGTTAMMLVLLFPAIGIGLIILAPILFIRSLRRSNRIKNLMQTGQKVQGVLIDMQSNGSDSNNSAQKIVVAATDTMGVVQNYVSDPLSGIGIIAMADFRNNPIPIDVYIDPTNPKNYYVDISDIPNLTPDRISELIKSATATMQPRSIAPEQPYTPVYQPPQAPGTPPLPPQPPRYN